MPTPVYVVTPITLAAWGGSPLSGYTWTLAPGSAFPPGTTVDPFTGIFHGNGSPLVLGGPYTFDMTVSDGSKTFTTTNGAFSFTVVQGGDIPFGTPPPYDAPFQQFPINIPIANAKAGAGYGASLYAWGGTSPYSSWSLATFGTLPPGLVIDQARGIVRGTPFSSAAGHTYPFQVNVLDATGTLALNQTTYNITVEGAALSDFNGDGFTDMTLKPFSLSGASELANPSTSTGQTAIWYLQGATFLGGAYGPVLPAGWVLACVADMNLDGMPDYVLFNPSTGQTAVWYMNGVTYVVGVFGPTLPSGWTLKGAVDFNGDGNPDYVLFNPGTGQTGIWYLNGVSYVSGAFGPTLPSGWTLIAVVDFNGDGQPDYELFNAGTSQTAIWYLNGVTFVGGAYGPTLPSGWTLNGAADFNGDGQPDYELFNPGTSQTAIWYLNGVSYVSGAYGPTLVAGYSLVSP